MPSTSHFNQLFTDRPLGHPDFTDIRYVVAGGALLLISPHELSGERRINFALLEKRCVRIIGQCVAQALADAIRQESGGRVLGGWESRRERIAIVLYPVPLSNCASSFI
jgi:hypothetical protein